LRQRLSQTLAIPGELFFQGVGKIQHDRRKTSHHSFGRSFKLSSKQCPQSLEEEEEISKVSYVVAVGSLIYDMVCTRPDLTYAVSTISQFMSNLGKNIGNQ